MKRERKRGKQAAYIADLDDTPPELITNKSPPSARFRKVITLWIPRRFVSASGIDTVAFVADVNDKIRGRGFVTSDGQVLRTPLDDLEVASGHPTTPDAWDARLTIPKFARIGTNTEVMWEPDGPPFDVPERREWGSAQREWFSLNDPYQMSEDVDGYSWSHLMTLVDESYLLPEEKIAGVIDGEVDRYYFYCPCHCAEVVYTTRHRLVCMGCGATHIVLVSPLSFVPKRLLTAEEWQEFFDDDGAYRDEEIDLTVIDFTDVEHRPTIWETSQWSEAKDRFIFFARSSPEEVAEAIRGTEADASSFLEAGFAPVAMPAPPAQQVGPASIDLELVDNAAHALRDGCSAFLAARREPAALINAIPLLFRAIELLVKTRLGELDPEGVNGRPNNPTVFKRLAALGVTLSQPEVETVGRLRKLRNELQHGRSTFNYRSALATCRKSIILLDRFAQHELDLWIGDAIQADDWFQLLRIRELDATAQVVVTDRLAQVRENPQSEVSECSRCGREAMVRPHPNTGADCVYCGFIAVDDQTEHDQTPSQNSRPPSELGP